MTDNSPGTVEDQRFLNSIKQGNRQAFGQLYDKYAPALMGIISRIANNEKLSEEILRLTFVKAWNLVATYDATKTSLFIWLINLTRQTAIEEMKSRQVPNLRNNTSVIDDSKGGVRDTGSMDMQNQLPSAFDLIFYKGLSCLEAAAALNITVAELKANLRMTIKNLQSQPNKLYADQ